MSARGYIICAMDQQSLPFFTHLALRSGILPAAIREYAEAHSTLFERAERLRAKAERLERAGTPSESARNRAERARREVEAGLAALRASFAGGRDGHRAFDREVTLRYPAFEVSGENH